MNADDENKELRFGGAIAAGAGTYILGNFGILVVSLADRDRLNHTQLITCVMPGVSLLVAVVVYWLNGGPRDDGSET